MKYSCDLQAMVWYGRERDARTDAASVTTWRNASVSSDPSGAADAPPDSSPGPLLLGPPVRSITVDWTRPGSACKMQCVWVRVG